MTPHIPFSDFLAQLFDTGTIVAAPTLIPIPDMEFIAGEQLIRAKFDVLALDYPSGIPEFNPDAARWSGQLIYYAVHLIVIRDAGAEVVARLLHPYTPTVTPSAIITADVCLSYLPEILRVAKGFAPGDILVKTLNDTAMLWPFSSTAMPSDTLPDLSAFASHPILMQLYTDRLLQHRNKGKLLDPLLAPWISQITGGYSDILTA